MLREFLDNRRYRKKTDTKIVPKILMEIKKNKIKALIKYEKKFNNNNEIKLSLSKVNKSIKTLDVKTKRAIDFAYNRIFKFHSLQKFKNIYFKDNLNNKLEYKYIPIESVGIYVPANLPSTLLMNAIPAKIAGVKKIILANPKLNGKLNPAVLYIAKKIGIKEIYSMGGAQAIGSLAYIQKVNKIVGPGNIYVSKAKREIFGEVGIENMIAGPSEITIVADNKTNFDEVLTSLIGQAEHDKNSQCILITKDIKLINKINKNVFQYLKNLPRKKIIYQSLKNNGLMIKVKNERQIIKIINEIAPEHLELNIKNYKKYLNKIINAGSVCLGNFSAMAVSDYNVGTNHVLPTGGSAKFYSPLSVLDFMKWTNFVSLDQEFVNSLAESAAVLAESEGLSAHARALRIRLDK